MVVVAALQSIVSESERVTADDAVTARRGGSPQSGYAPAPMGMPRRERALRIAGRRPLLSADLATVTWLTGLATDIEYGPNPFTTAPLVVLDPDGSVLTITSEDEAGGVSEGVETRTFTGFAVEDVDRPEAAARLALEALGSASAVSADVSSLPGGVAAELVQRGVELIDVGAELRAARAAKDPDEVAAIRASIRIADVGQAAARASFAPGRSELDVWAAVRAAMESEAGGRVPLLADLVTGERTAEVGGPPSGRVIDDCDLLLVDLVPRLGGYWADSCVTVALGEPRDEVTRAHRAATDALRRGIDMLRPGVRAGEVDAGVRETIERAGGSYPHHTGHGLGTAFHEEPRIIPGSDRELESGMVVALEPGIYAKDWGLRVERVVLVTEEEPEILSGHDLAL
jgi:Xaa-Pro dipeptidase